MFHRLLRSSDFDACVPLLHPGFRADPQVCAKLPSIWRRLHVNGQLHGGTVVDPARPEPDAIVAVGMSVFVSEPFLAGYLASPAPYVSALVYEQILAGRSPVLPPNELPAANSSGGLNLLILHFGVRRSGADEDRVRAIAATAQEGFRLSHVGYRVRRVLQEAYGPQELPFFKAGGFQLKSDYEGHAARNGDRWRPEERPYLMGLYREDPESCYPGNGMSDLFQHAEPRFHFAPAEQRVLLRAVMDASDADIADALGVSHDAVKKCWRRVFERTVAAAPDMFGDVLEDEGTRGKEKRRRLLQYLRYHLEELRPFARPRPLSHVSAGRRR
jgi:DNA-binding CsgD family transcriptional regulator